MKAEIKGGILVLSRRGHRDKTATDGGSILRLPVVQNHRRFWVWSILVLLAAVLAILSAVFLRQNNLNMAQLRDELVTADETGDIEQVQLAAQRLQNYVAHHMHTMTGRIALQTLYEQAAEQAMEASKPPEISTDIYMQATNDCKPQLAYGYRSWASCVATKVGLNSTTTLAVADEVAPDPDLYYVEYAPVRWSADLAGICLLLLTVDLIILGVGLLAVVIRKIYHLWSKRPAKGVYRG